MNSKIKNRFFLQKHSFDNIERKEYSTRKIGELPKYLDRLEFGIWIWYGLENRLFLSESFSRIMGMPKGMILNLEVLVEYIYSEDLEKFLDYLEGLLDGVLPEGFVFRVGEKEPRTIQCVVEGMGERDVVGVCWQLTMQQLPMRQLSM